MDWRRLVLPNKLKYKSPILSREATFSNPTRQLFCSPTSIPDWLSRQCSFLLDTLSNKPQLLTDCFPDYTSSKLCWNKTATVQHRRMATSRDEGQVEFSSLSLTFWGAEAYLYLYLDKIKIKIEFSSLSLT